MGNRKISEDMKLCALRLWASGWVQDDICKILGISGRSLYRWQHIFEDFGHAVKPPSPLHGRICIITRIVMDSIHLLYQNHPDTYLDELLFWLAIHHDIIISPSALQRNLREAGLTCKLLHKIAAERDEEEQTAWHETSKNDHRYYRRYGYALRGETPQLVDVFVRGQRYSLVAGLTLDGYIAAKVIPGSFDSQTFFDFIVEDVLPQTKPWPDECSAIVLDNCRIHYAEMLADVVHAAGEYCS
ncbi:hypothetical protein WOLCODRAFT_68487 [Wolfiporia cocos MD-104 SS10]|uniref:Tc1-like transposase DDE domain-containing protein n=1 Tax=Wolfiporia cocos (strain MD-104) TaxID=742152 RepID=A0A2H3JPX0_WOLCO|nr:hypothetical protein WOLCODRAFT_68487 [Wolfiporia cocos MD-104 SS10]